jgi:hypothetical protein
VARRRLLIAAGGGGRVDGADARTGARPHHDDAPQPGAAARSTDVTKEERMGDDDGDVMPTPARRQAGPTGQRVLLERGRWRHSRVELGPCFYLIQI